MEYKTEKTIQETYGTHNYKQKIKTKPNKKLSNSIRLKLI